MMRMQYSVFVFIFTLTLTLVVLRGLQWNNLICSSVLRLAMIN